MCRTWASVEFFHADNFPAFPPHEIINTNAIIITKTKSGQIAVHVCIKKWKHHISIIFFKRKWIDFTRIFKTKNYLLFSPVWSDDDLCAQAVLFFVAGFDTVSTVMSFVLYELAVNPDVQDKLYKEIRENETKNNGKFDYNSIQTMVYMDKVVSGNSLKTSFLI